jgi:hypothetical protein
LSGSEHDAKNLELGSNARAIRKPNWDRTRRAAISLAIRRKPARGGHHSDIQEAIMTQRDPGSMRRARIGTAARSGAGFPVKQERTRGAPNSHGLATIDFDK